MNNTTNKTQSYIEKKDDGFVDVKHIDLRPQRPLESKKLGGPRTTRLTTVRRGRKRGKNIGAKGTVRLPPEIQASVIIGHTFRFQNLSDVTQTTFSVGNIIGICGVIGTVTNSTVVSVASCVKVRKLVIWPAEESTTVHNPEVSWASTTYGTDADRSVTKSLPAGITVTGGFSSRPKRDTLASLWQNSSTTSSTMFTIYDLPKGSVLDLHVSFMLRNSQNGVSYTGITTAVVGTMYYMYMDGASTHVFQPVGLPNTF